MPVHLAELALSVARCPEVPKAAADPAHPCHKVVHSQDQFEGPFQVPEAWAGGLDTAGIAYLSSNPAISAGDLTKSWASKRIAEKYPTVEWDDNEIADFMTTRFGDDERWVSRDLRHRKVDGSWGSPEPYWKWVKRQTEKIVDAGRPWHESSVMTEVVHCKSGDEVGVPEATMRCSSMHLDRILQACPAGLIVVVGGKAATTLLNTNPDVAAEYPNFGVAIGGQFDPSQNIFEYRLGGRNRLICYSRHPNSRGEKVDLATMYPDDIERLVTAANIPAMH